MSTEGLYDIHCHILPGIDDGARDWETSLKMLDMARQEGIRHIAATPHYRHGMFQTDAPAVVQRVQELQKRCDEAGYGITIHSGCEFHSCIEMPQMLRNRQVCTMGGGRHVLTEFSYDAAADYMTEITNELFRFGYIPIIAHVERYQAARTSLSTVEELRKRGCLIQVNAQSMIGKAGFGTKRYCKKLMDRDWIDLIGSDAHNLTTRPFYIKRCMEYLEKKQGKDYAVRIMVENPRKVLDRN